MKKKNKYHILPKVGYFASLLTVIALFSGCALRKPPQYLWQARGKIAIITEHELSKASFTWQAFAGQQYQVVLQDLFGRNIATAKGSMAQLTSQLQQQLHQKLPIITIANILQQIETKQIAIPYRTTIAEPNFTFKIVILKVTSAKLL